MIFNIEKIDSFTGHKDSVFNLETFDSPTTFLSSGADGMIVSWDIKHPDLGKPIIQLQNSSYAKLYENENNQLILGNNNEGIVVFDTINNKIINSVKLNNALFFDIKTFENNIYVADSVGLIHIIDKKNLAFKKHIKASTESVRRIIIHKSRNEIIAAYSDNTIKIFDLENYSLKHVLLGHNNSVFSMALTNEGKTLVTGSRDAHLMVWDVENTYKRKMDINAHNFAINDIIEIKDKGIILSCSMDKTIKVWDSESFKLLKVLDKARYAGHATSINRLLWMQKPQILLSASDDRTISMWNLF